MNMIYENEKNQIEKNVSHSLTEKSESKIFEAINQDAYRKLYISCTWTNA